MIDRSLVHFNRCLVPYWVPLFPACGYALLSSPGPSVSCPPQPAGPGTGCGLACRRGNTAATGVQARGTARPGFAGAPSPLRKHVLPWALPVHLFVYISCFFFLRLCCYFWLRLLTWRCGLPGIHSSDLEKETHGSFVVFLLGRLLYLFVPKK